MDDALIYLFAIAAVMIVAIFYLCDMVKHIYYQHHPPDDDGMREERFEDDDQGTSGGPSATA